MKHKLNMKEKISALADGELSDFETRRLLEEISSDPEYREFWKNIQLTKLALTEEGTNLLDKDLTNEILFSYLVSIIKLPPISIASKSDLFILEIYSLIFLSFFSSGSIRAKLTAPLFSLIDNISSKTLFIIFF